MPKKIEPSVANETQLNAARIGAAVLLGVILGARGVRAAHRTRIRRFVWTAPR